MSNEYGLDALMKENVNKESKESRFRHEESNTAIHNIYAILQINSCSRNVTGK